VTRDDVADQTERRIESLRAGAEAAQRYRLRVLPDYGDDDERPAAEELDLALSRAEALGGTA
jgi:hypothetical protein